MMLDFEFYKIAEEFLKIEDITKFFSNALKLSNGKLASYWFRGNKKKIETSDIMVCKKIMEQYDEYVEKAQKGIVGTCGQFSRASLTEFANIKDLNKFDSECQIVLSNGMTCGSFFYKYHKNIFDLSGELSIDINKQYQEYLFQKRQNELKKQIKFKHEFYRERDLNKFSFYSKLVFSDGQTLMHGWFDENKSRIYDISEKYKIEGNTTSIEAKILRQYEDYLSFYELKQYFLSEPDFAKFSDDEDWVVRFPSGASMSMWWGDFRDMILSSNCPVDVAIHEQYNSYVKTMKQKND